MNDYLLRLIPLVVTFVIAVVVNCYTKARVAYYLGDPTPKIAGRISLNPLVHLDIAGTVALFFFYLGWAKPMPVNFNDLGRRRWAVLAIELSGAAANILLGLAAGLVYFILKKLEPPTNLDLRTLKLAVEMFGTFNIFFALLSLVPLPQLPGFRALVGLFYHKPQGVLDSQALMYMGWVLLVVLVLWTPLLQWLTTATSFFISPFGMPGQSYFGYFNLTLFGGL